MKKVIFTALLAACAVRAWGMDVTLEAGIAHHSIPSSGTWWEDNYPNTWHLNSAAWGVGLAGDNWSVAYEDSGAEYSDAVACQTTITCPRPIHWYGTQRPHGVWAAYEPTILPERGVFVQLGGGAYRTGFAEHIPDFPSGPGIDRGCMCVTNRKTELGALAGLGIHMTKHVDVVANYRYAPARGDDSMGCFIGLGASVMTVSIRGRF